MKNPSVIYADVEWLLEKINTFHNNPENSSTAQINMHTHSGYSMFKQCSFYSTKNILDCYKDKDCMERFCKVLKEHVTRIIKDEKKEMIPLTDKENKSYEKQNVCYICKKESSTHNDDDDDNKKYQKVRGHCHYTG